MGGEDASEGRVEAVMADGVLALTLDRVDKRNALTESMYAALAGELERANRADEVRAILISGRGDHFCGGNDIAEAAALGTGGIAGESQSVRFIRSLIDCELPLVAAVRGHAVGIGATMLLHCDAVFLASTASLAMPFLHLGVVPEACSSILLPAASGYLRAFAMLGLGRRLDAATAERWGLATEVVGPDEVLATARAAALALAKAPVAPLRHAKRLLRDRTALHGRATEECAIGRELLGSEHAQRTLGEFLRGAARKG